MLLDFTVGNYRSFKDKQTIVFDTKSNKRETSNSMIENISLIYGPNSSGKSNLIRAIDYSSKLINGKTINNSDMRNEPYSGRNHGTSRDPTFFEYRLFINNHVFRYGFEIECDCFAREWLYDATEEEKKLYQVNHQYKTLSEEADLLIMTGVSKHPESKTIKDKFGHELGWIRNWFKNDLLVNLGDSSNILPMEITPSILDELVDLLSEYKVVLDGIDLVRKERSGVESIPHDNTRNEVIFNNECGKAKLCYREKNSKITKTFTFRCNKSDGGHLIDQESAGTMRLVYLLLVYLNHRHSEGDAKRMGRTVILDEIECSIDTPSLLHILSYYWNHPISRIQVIATTHESKLLSDGRCSNENIWFIDRRRAGSDCTHIYSLSSFEIMPDVMDAAYRDGMFGAVPIMRMPRFGGE